MFYYLLNLYEWVQKKWKNLRVQHKAKMALVVRVYSTNYIILAKNNSISSNKNSAKGGKNITFFKNYYFDCIIQPQQQK